MAGTNSSGTTLARKLGLKAGQAAAFVALPEDLSALADAAAFRRIETAPDWRALPEGARDVIHMFTTSAADLTRALPVLRDLITAEGMIWISWPKKAAKVPTDLSEDAVRAIAGAEGMEAAKAAVVDPVWWGLKLVVRAEARATHVNSGVAA
jgi:hypothetical protein